MNTVLDAGTALIPVIDKTARDLFGDTNSPPGTDNVNAVINGIRGALTQISTSVSTGTANNFAQSLIQEKIFQFLGPYLADNDDPDTTVDKNDVVFVEPFDPAGGNVFLDLNLQKVISFSDDLNFGLGLPGFPLQVTVGGVIGLDIIFAYKHLRFGLQNGEFQVDTSALNEINLGLNAGCTAGTLKSQFGFLQIQNRADQPITLALNGNFSLDVDSSGDSFIDNPLLDVTACVRLPFETKPVSILTTDFQLPTIRGDFKLDWNIAHISPTAGIAEFGSPPKVSLDNVEIQVGGLMQYIAGPMMTYLPTR